MWRLLFFARRDVVSVPIAMAAANDHLGAFGAVGAPAAMIAAIVIALDDHDLAMAAVPCASFSTVTRPCCTSRT